MQETYIYTQEDWLSWVADRRSHVGDAQEFKQPKLPCLLQWQDGESPMGTLGTDWEFWDVPRLLEVLAKLNGPSQPHGI